MRPTRLARPTSAPLNTAEKAIINAKQPLDRIMTSRNVSLMCTLALVAVMVLALTFTPERFCREQVACAV